MLSRRYHVEIMVACCAVVVEKLDLSKVVTRAVVAYPQRRNERIKCDNVVGRLESCSQEVSKQLQRIRKKIALFLHKLQRHACSEMN
jgi:hypothetical protein